MDIFHAPPLEKKNLMTLVPILYRFGTISLALLGCSVRQALVFQIVTTHTHNNFSVLPIIVPIRYMSVPIFQFYQPVCDGLESQNCLAVSRWISCAVHSHSMADQHSVNFSQYSCLEKYGTFSNQNGTLCTHYIKKKIDI